jgi:hypothetical protein
MNKLKKLFPVFGKGKIKFGVWLTCHGSLVEAAIKHIYGDRAEITFAPNWVYIADNKKLPNAFKNLDFFIFQPLKREEGDYYSDYNVITNIVSPRSIQLRVPYLMSTGLYPWARGKSHPIIQTGYPLSWVEEYITEKGNSLGLLESINDEARYQVIIDNHKSSQNALRENASATDIPEIFQFVEDNILERPIYYTNNHPRGNLAFQFIKMIFDKLGLDQPPTNLEKVLDQVLTPECSPIFPVVERALGLKFSQKEAWFTGLMHAPVDRHDYAFQYAQKILDHNTANKTLLEPTPPL